MDLRIEIEPGSDPIRGVLHSGDPSLGHRFVGWMGLVELIASATGNLGESPSDQEQRD